MTLDEIPPINTEATVVVVRGPMMGKRYEGCRVIGPDSTQTQLLVMAPSGETLSGRLDCLRLEYTPPANRARTLTILQLRLRTLLDASPDSLLQHLVQCVTDGATPQDNLAVFTASVYHGPEGSVAIVSFDADDHRVLHLQPHKQ